MLFISMDDFIKKADTAQRSSESEKELAVRMKNGDPHARSAMLARYLPLVSALVKHAPSDVQTLQTVYKCMSVLEKSIDSFDFWRAGESFTHYLSIRLRQCIIKCITDRP